MKDEEFSTLMQLILATAGSEDEQPYLFNAKDCSESNWMRYVNCASTVSGQSLTRYQHQKQIYYRSHCDIQPGTELLVWYGAEYAQELNITRDTACRPSGRLGPADNVITCPYCRLIVSDNSILERHMNGTHGDLCNANKPIKRDKDSIRSCHFMEDSLSTKTKSHKKSNSEYLPDLTETC